MYAIMFRAHFLLSGKEKTPQKQSFLRARAGVQGVEEKGIGFVD